jgi:chorismate mutase
MMRAVRGATTVDANTREAIVREVYPLLEQLCRLNHLSPERIVSVFFTVTSDLTAVSPAFAARTTMPGWEEVALMCAQEPDVEGLPARCVRVLIHFNADFENQAPLVPVYLNGAVQLRPDWAQRQVEP